VIIRGTRIEVRNAQGERRAAGGAIGDCFAREKDGNVRYFGENTAVLSGGLRVDLSGTWTGAGIVPSRASPFGPTRRSAIPTANKLVTLDSA
jgi:hypothetical protein